MLLECCERICFAEREGQGIPKERGCDREGFLAKGLELEGRNSEEMSILRAEGASRCIRREKLRKIGGC